MASVSTDAETEIFGGGAINTQHIFVLSSVSDYKILGHITEGDPVCVHSSDFQAKCDCSPLHPGSGGKRKKKKKNGVI